MGVMQAVEIFCQTLPHFILAKITVIYGIIRENEIVRRYHSPHHPGISYHNLPCEMDHSDLSCERFFQADLGSVNRDGTYCRQHFSKCLIHTRSFRLLESCKKTRKTKNHSLGPLP